jgi:hypothetical protein
MYLTPPPPNIEECHIFEHELRTSIAVSPHWPCASQLSEEDLPCHTLIRHPHDILSQQLNWHAYTNLPAATAKLPNLPPALNTLRGQMRQ